MATYDFVFSSLGLEDWCSDGQSDAPMSMAALLQKTKGTDAEAESLWDLPFPSMDALNESCAAFPKSRELTKGLEEGFLSIKDSLSVVLDPLTQPLSWFLDGTLYGMLNTPWWIVIPALLAVVFVVTKSWKLVGFVAGSLVLLAFIDYYQYAMETLSIIFVCAFLCVLLGVPIGIAMSRSDMMQRLTIPVLDMLQTLPPFVYLIPLIFLFSVTESKLYGIAIILYAIVPVIRLTNLGIRLVDKDVIEAADAFGMTSQQKLFKVQIPLALPNIMAGVNQTIMMSLAMVVIASLVSAPGLGVLVLQGIRNLELGVGLVAGLGIVILAVILDRVTKGLTGAHQRLTETVRERIVDRDIKISIRNLYKIFGPIPDVALAYVRRGMGKAELLEKHNHVLGLQDINVDMREGEITVIMGLSGSGKSTLIRHLNRLIEPTAGEIKVDGKNVLAFDEDGLRKLRREQMSMVFQKFALLPHKTVLENAGMALLVRGHTVRDFEDEAKKWLARVGLEGNENQYPHQLSGGMQQRVGIARALASNSPVMLMDEAFSALDPLIRSDMQDLLLELQEELKKTVVFITHDLDEALKLADHLVILKDGHIVQQGEPQEILMHPNDPYITDFISDINRARVLRVRSVMAKTTEPPADSAGDISDRDNLESVIARSDGDTDLVYRVVKKGNQVGILEMKELVKALVPVDASEGDNRSRY